MRLSSPTLRTLLAVFLAAASRAGAQTASESIPVSLVNALFGGGGREIRTLYFVGVVPPGWPSTLTPPAPATVLGATQGRRQLTAVFVDSVTRDPLPAYERRLRDAGWSRPAMQSLMFGRGGFQSGDGRMPFWCSDAGRVTTNLRPAAGSASYLRIVYESMPRGTCAPAPDSMPFGREGDPRLTLLAIPPLYAPPGLRSEGGGGGSGGTSINASTRFDSTTMTPAALLDHYGAQLASAGWTAFPVSVNPSFASQLFEARDALKRSWHGVLIVMPTGTTRDVTLIMTRPDDRSGRAMSSGALTPR